MTSGQWSGASGPVASSPAHHPPTTRLTAGAADRHPAAPPPDDLPALKRWLAARPDAERLHPIATQQILVQSDALAHLLSVLRDLEAPDRVVLAMDETPMRRGEDDLKPLVYEVLSGGGRAVLPFVFAAAESGAGPHAPVHADLAGAARLRAAIGDAATAVVALGSGTVCDMAKQACSEADRAGVRTALVLVPTALSVTAFTSSLAVLLKDGVKRTFPSRFPDAVVCDLATLGSTPEAMTLAGLGDCCARFVSYGDWYVSHALGLVDVYSETPLALMGENLDETYLAQAAAVHARSEEGLRFLARQVLLAGLAQSVVQLSAPLSGSEHVISHLLDMGAAAWGRRPALHGAQVGVSTPLAARAWEVALDRFDPTASRPTPPAESAMHERVQRTFAPLDPTGRMADECWRDYVMKLAQWRASERRFDEVRERWSGEVAPRLRQLVRPSATIRAILRAADHPLGFDALDPPIPADQARFAVANAHLIRRRFTVGDLFTWLDLGVESLADALLDAPAAGAG